MAKYTDPNTGIKYSTHTGLKVFAVIITVLLVVSIVLNVVLMIQGDDGVSESGSGDLGPDSSSSSETTPALESGFVSGGSYTVDEDGQKIYDEPPETADSEVVDEPVQVENEAVTDVSDFDENGVATCVYEGKNMYLTLGGGVYDFYPYSYTLAPISMTAEIAEIQVSAIFNKEPERKGKYFNSTPSYIEVSSITGEPLNIVSIASQGMLFYWGVDEDGNLITIDVSDDSECRSFSQSFDAISTDVVIVYKARLEIDSYEVLSVELANDDLYSYGFSSLSGAFAFIPDDVAEDDMETEDEGDMSSAFA